MKIFPSKEIVNEVNRLEDMQDIHTLYDMAVKRTFAETDTEEKANIDYIVYSIVYLSAFTKEQVYNIIHSTWKHSRNSEA